MTITTTTLTRAAGLAAIAAGVLFSAVQIGHPHLDAAFATTTEYAVRETIKLLFAALALAGITGMYLRQVRQTGLLGLLGYLLFGTGLVLVLSVQVIGLGVLPSLTTSQPAFVDDVLAVAGGGTATGDIGLFATLSTVSGIAYIGGGLLFGIALFRAGILARWAAALLAVGALATAAIPLLPMINPRLFAIPVGVALARLGYSLWSTTRTATPRTASARTVPGSRRVQTAGAE
jgi:hypothetical protein